MRITMKYEFDLPADERDYMDLVHASNISAVLWDFYLYLEKRMESDMIRCGEVELEKAHEKLRDLCVDWGVREILP